MRIIPEIERFHPFEAKQHAVIFYSFGTPVHAPYKSAPCTDWSFTCTPKRFFVYRKRKPIKLLFYMVNRCTFFTFITTPPNQPEYLGTGFVLSPKARAALFRTLASNQLHCKNDFSHWGWRVFRAYGARRAPHNGHEGDTGYVFFEELGTLITLPNCWEVA